MLMVVKGQCAIWFDSYVTNYRKLHNRIPTPAEAFAACREQHGNESSDQENIQRLLDLQIISFNKEEGITKFV